MNNSGWRMVLGVFVYRVLVALMSRQMRWHREAMRTYLATGLGLWGAMTSVYWAAQHIPSGLISVSFLGQYANGEIVGPKELIGTAVIIAGLACYQWGDRWLERRV